MEIGRIAAPTPDGRLDVPALMAAFLAWWRNNAAIIAPKGPLGYREAIAHLTFGAFLARVVNGGGTIQREYAAGRRAVDVVIDYRGERHVFELKRVPPKHRSLETVRAEGIAQLGRYLDTLDVAEGWLVVFYQRAKRSWDERLWAEEHVVGGRVLHVRGA
jgi:hypothetical protein